MSITHKSHDNQINSASTAFHPQALRQRLGFHNQSTRRKVTLVNVKFDKLSQCILY